MPDGIGLRASLGSAPAADGAGLAPGVAGAWLDPCAVMRRTGPAVQSAGLPTCQNHSPAAQARGRGELHGRRARRRRGPVEAPAVLGDGAAAVDHRGRAGDADDERALPVGREGQRRAGLDTGAVGGGHRRRHIGLRAGRRGEHDDGRERGRGKAQGREHRRPR